MGARRIWSEYEDNTIKADRWLGHSWDKISTKLNIPRFTLIDRGRKLGAIINPDLGLVDTGLDREGQGGFPLPPGHKLSWGPLVAGTFLENIPYENLV